MESVGASRAASLLDIGCGHGLLSERLHHRGFTNIAGCDWLPPEEVASPVMRYTQIDMDAVGLAPYPDRSFALVVCSDVLGHLENPAAMLRGMERVLAPDGRIFLTLPNAFNVFERLRILRSGNSSRYRSERRSGSFGHISMLPSRVLESLCDRAGLMIVAVGKGYWLLGNHYLFPTRSFGHLLSYNCSYALSRKADGSKAAIGGSRSE